MCGILGLIHNAKYSISIQDFEELNNLNYRRGPDSQSIIDINILNYKLKLGHTRLSIQDLSSEANQPMSSFSERFIISFNGEIYNHQNLRKLLENKNFNNWKTTSDTETLVNLFEFYHFHDVLSIIEGMFSFILLDLKEKKIYFSRDLAGEKPLYMSFDNSFIIASSDLNAIKKLPNFSKQINKDVLKNYLQYNYIPNPETIFAHTFKLPPASFLEIDLKTFKFRKFENFESLLNNNSVKFDYWWKYNNNDSLSKINKNDLEHLIHEKIKKSVKNQLISDVPLGAFLSAGIDSSLIVSIMQEFQSNTKTFTIGYENKAYDESHESEKIAKYLSTEHTSYNFSNNEISTFIENTPYVYSEPFADSSQLPTLLVSKLAKEKVKVVLTGDGGDELFGGYNRYIYANKYWKYFKLINPKIRNFILNNIVFLSPKYFYKLINLILRTNLSQDSISKINSKLSYINNEISYYHALTKEWNQSDILIDQSITNYSNIKLENKIKNIFKLNENIFEKKMMLADFYTYLPDDILCKVDRATMFYSLESRAPYLSKDLIETAFKIPLKYKINKGKSKLILRKILSNYLPDNLINSKKMGFGIPIGELIKKDLKQWTLDILSKDMCNKHNFFNYEVINKTLKNHLINNQNNQYKLWSIIQFNLWYENLQKNE